MNDDNSYDLTLFFLKTGNALPIQAALQRHVDTREPIQQQSCIKGK